MVNFEKFSHIVLAFFMQVGIIFVNFEHIQENKLSVQLT